MSTRLEQGRQAYFDYCVPCHKADGAGQGAFLPSLRISPDTLRYKQQLIGTVLSGKFDRGGEYEGHTIPMMPSWDYLGNEQIADIITYMSHEWSDAPVVVTTEEVARQRGLVLWDEMDTPPNERATGVPRPLNEAQSQRAKEIYFSRCVGCHGVHRDGAVGSSLRAWFMRERGSGYLQSIINYGTHSGMPNWGTSERLDAQDIALLTRYLQHQPSEPPPFSEDEVAASWRVIVPTKVRPSRRQHPFKVGHLFAAALHDTGQIMLIDGDSKEIVATVHVGVGPHRMDVSPNGRYLYVICRDGVVSAIDLFMNAPTKVAEVRIGFEARTITVQRTRGYPAGVVVAGAYAPGQFSVLDGRTLEPLSTLKIAPEPGSHKVTDLVALTRRGGIWLASSDEDRFFVIDVGQPTQPKIREVSGPRFMRAGSLDRSGRYVLAGSDDGQVVVVEAKTGKVIANVETPDFLGAVTGTVVVDPEHGPLWIASSMIRGDVLAVGTDPKRHPDAAWQVVRRMEGRSGSLHAQSHPKSRNLWIDSPLNSESSISQTVAVFDTADLEGGFDVLPIAEWAALGEGVKRVLHPQYDAAGDEVWFVVWNPQNLTSAIVIVDDDTRTLRRVIKDNRLITPIRNFSLAHLSGK